MTNSKNNGNTSAGGTIILTPGTGSSPLNGTTGSGILSNGGGNIIFNGTTLPVVTTTTATVNASGWFSFPGIMHGIDYAIDADYAVVVDAKQKKITIGVDEGYECSECTDFYPMAELNQPNDVEEYTKFTCYGCRQGLKTIF